MPLKHTFFLLLVTMICIRSFSRFSPLRLTSRVGVKVLNTRFTSTLVNGAAAKANDQPTVDACNAQLLAMELPTNENSLNLLKTRHTSAHILAMAVQKSFPKVKVTVGPWIDSG